jgi:hypothetical protein
MRKDYATAANNVLIYAELIHALRALDGAGVPVIVLKGAALAETIYPSIADRAMGDADLLVRPEDRDRARITLEAAGHRFAPEARQSFSPFDTEFTGEMAFYRHGILIELHWQLTPSEPLRRMCHLDAESLWHNAQPLALQDWQTLQLSPCDTLLHLCLHLTVHGYTHPVGPSDIARLLDYYRPFPWDSFVSRARDARLSYVSYFVLEAVRTLGRASVPDDVLEGLRPPSWRRALLGQVASPRRALAGEISYSRQRSYLIQLASADRLVDVLRLFVWLLFPGPRWLGERYRLRGRARPLFACFWHPMVVFWQGMLALWDVARGHGA